MKNGYFYEKKGVPNYLTPSPSPLGEGSGYVERIRLFGRMLLNALREAGTSAG